MPMRWNKRNWLIIGLGVTIIVLAAYTAYRLYQFGAFYSVPKTSGNQSITTLSIPGVEALQLDADSGMLFFIGDYTCEASTSRGNSYYMDLETDTSVPHKFNFSTPEDFHPHGLSYFRGSSGDQFLFTNNHRTDGTHTVEVFQITADMRLIHQKTIRSSELTSPNDLVAISPSQFYLTNDGRSHDQFNRSIDAFFNRSEGKVLFYDGERFHTVADKLNFPNGIAFEKTSGRLYVGESLSGNILIYQPVDNQLKLQHSIRLIPGIDNIGFTQSGRLLIAIHPNLFALSRYKSKQEYPSPSLVYELDVNSNQPEIIFQSSGEVLSGVSSAIRFRNKLFLGNACSGLHIVDL